MDYLSASSLLTQSDSEIEVNLDIPVHIGYGDYSDNQMELGGSMKFGDSSPSGNVETMRSTCSNRARRCSSKYSPRLESDSGYNLH